jgi:DtxR family transcriptional regulator, Mn-dependent transcriptional regulator
MDTTADILLSASVEDYLEAIVNLSEDGTGTVRSTDIASLLGVSKASVTGALRVLRNKGLALYEPYGAVTLTALGRRLGNGVVERHRVLTSFFETVLGVDSQHAQQAACKVEHVVNPKIIVQLTRFVEFVGHSRQRGVDVVGEFRRFCGTRTKGRTQPQKSPI